jgi:hypothetical protein
VTPADRPISIVAGDLYTHVVNFFDDDAQASATDLTGREFKAQIRKDATTVAPILEEFDVNDDDADTGIIVLSLTGAQTTDLHARVVQCGWDFQEITVGETDPITLFQGVVTVIGDYTR